MGSFDFEALAIGPYREQTKIAKNRGPAALEKVPGLRGVLIFGMNFYCIFVRFGKMTHLINLKKCRGSSPGCPGGCRAPGSKASQGISRRLKASKGV